MSTPVVYGDYLYLGNSNGVVRCFNARTGEKVYEERLESGAAIISSPVAADGKIYCASENGTVYALAAGPEFKVLARNKMGQPCFATPAILQGTLYIRTTESLFTINWPDRRRRKPECDNAAHFLSGCPQSRHEESASLVSRKGV